MIISIPKDVQFIIDTFYKNGYEAFMVGGCVRDSLLKKEPHDFDITTSAPPEVTVNLFDNTIPTGLKHGTISVLINNVPYEVTTYRTDGEYIDNRRPDSVRFVTNIYEDLSRRDFTINALAYNHIDKLVDHFNGVNDLNNKIIRTVGDADKRYNEDALRMLRAIRFSSQLNFDIEDTTYNSIIKNSHLIKNISNERICSELTKIAMSNDFNKGFSMLQETEILKLIMPEINFISNKNIDSLPKDLSTRLSYLFINTDIDTTTNILKHLKFDNKTVSGVSNLLLAYPLISECNSVLKCKKLLQLITKDNIFNLLCLFEICNNTELTYIRDVVNTLIKDNCPLYIKDLNINGKILKENFSLSSGKMIGEILNYLLDCVMEEKVKNNSTDLLKATNNYLNSQLKN